MQKLQIFVSKSQGGFRLDLLRNPLHQVDFFPVDQGQSGIMLTPPLPSSEAYAALQIWQPRFSGKMRFFWWHILARRQRQNQVDVLPVFRSDGLIEELLPRLEEVVEGRILSEQRLMGFLRQEGFWPSDISRALDVVVSRGQIVQFPGFQTAPWGRKVCSRCQSEEMKTAPCLQCGRKDCLLCLACGSMGEHRSCSTLLALKQPKKTNHQRERNVEPKLELDYQLTIAQQEASEGLLQFWEEGEGKALVWAACGAGKTEVTFALMQRALREGGEVLFAIPRQDIVREMTERLRQAFPGVTVASHYGGQPWFAPGELVVATTHQVLHFYQRFTLAILDEVDAFPYQGSEMLRQGIQRALMLGGKLIEMTATPHSRREYKKVITIPARYHGFSLPEPELLVSKLQPWTTLQAQDFPPRLLESLQIGEHPWLVFAPTIDACGRLKNLLEEVLKKPVGLCHSKVENRAEVVQNLRDGKLDVVVTTSVLERGVNFPNIGVIVLYADHAVFTVSALVQIAGRVGRTAASPRGTVLFLASRITTPMKKARELVRHLNHQAHERGLLSSEDVT
ncbi:MAG TPA: helicase-related protein [Limnochordia bacterium]|nr:helicase-related protein [Limnochordia bacterium]